MNAVNKFAPCFDAIQTREERKAETKESGYQTRAKLTLVKKERESLLENIERCFKYNLNPSRLNKRINNDFVHRLVPYLETYLENYIFKYGSYQGMFLTREGSKLTLMVELERAKVPLSKQEFIDCVLPLKNGNRLDKASLTVNPLPVLDVQIKERTTTVLNPLNLVLPAMEGIYFVKMTDKRNGDWFYKVGITKNPLERFLDLDDFEVEFLYYGISDNFKIDKIEKAVLEAFNDYKHYGVRKFEGYTETFTNEIPVDEVLAFLQSYSRLFNRYEVEV